GLLLTLAALPALAAGLQNEAQAYGDLVIVGPPSDPAHIRGMNNAVAAFQALNAARGLFLSRADNPAIFRVQTQLWKLAGVNPHAANGVYLVDATPGMGSALDVASDMGAYTLVERASWLAYNNSQRGLELMVAGDPRLLQYGALPAAPGQLAARPAIDPGAA